MLAGLSAVCYILWASLGAVMTVGTFFPHAFAEHCGVRHPKIRGMLMLMEVHVSFRSEMPMHLLVFKCLVVKLTAWLGGFGYWVPWMVYYALDIPTMVACVFFFWEMLQDKAIIQQTLTSLGSTDTLTHFMDLPWLLRLVNPAWRPDQVLKYPNICYATHDEVKDAIRQTNNVDVQYKLRLDVYTPAQPSKKLRPVILHCHGGAWIKGTKDIFYPYQKLLVSQDGWVAVNIAYRLAPESPYPAHLYDYKRALRWVKKNIHVFGGDPNFVVLAGDSAGGHLSAMTAMTANDPEWQPGFEDVDTSVRGVIGLSAAMDIQGDQYRKQFFLDRVMVQASVEQSVLDYHSPLARLQKKEMADNKLVPYLLFAGQRDALVDVSVGRHFKAAFQQVSNECSLVVLPTSHHIWYIFWSPRSFYGAQLIQSWCRRLHLPYDKNK
ncbi:alpha/beta-hydrolase [Hesseltinella vesiculosa]|uniref:Alpha/beta-hydrolase n=1 Tax=Hesseltinella vesiculosa TaxID=101127 RepID=A0A1X2GNY8_9FUNG|nr:alpha/beta-hydrolase [Hesseltinella vesiculosa]